MSFVIAVPEVLAAAATELTGIGPAISAANPAVTAPTKGVVAAAADEVSVQIAALFGGHAQAYQTVSAQATAFHDQFVRALNAGAGSYGVGGYGAGTRSDGFGGPGGNGGVGGAGADGGNGGDGGNSFSLNDGFGSYASAEAANVQQTLLNLVNAPSQALTGRVLQ